MSERPGWTDEQVDQILGNLLRTGVLLATSVVLIGGLLYVARHSGELPDYRKFHGANEPWNTPSGIVSLVLQGSAHGIIQLGIVLLIATPVARVVFSVYAFARQRDFTYVVVTLIVLGVLLYSLVGSS